MSRIMKSLEPYNKKVKEVDNNIIAAITLFLFSWGQILGFMLSDVSVLL